MYITSIVSFRMGHKIITDWGKLGSGFIGIEKHFMGDTLMQKRYIVAEARNKVVVKNRNLFGKFDMVV